MDIIHYLLYHIFREKARKTNSIFVKSVKPYKIKAVVLQLFTIPIIKRTMNYHSSPLVVIQVLKNPSAGLSGNPTIEARSRKQLNRSQDVSGRSVQSWQAA